MSQAVVIMMVVVVAVAVKISLTTNRVQLLKTVKKKKVHKHYKIKFIKIFLYESVNLQVDYSTLFPP